MWRIVRIAAETNSFRPSPAHKRVVFPRCNKFYQPQLILVHGAPLVLIVKTFFSQLGLAHTAILPKG